MVWTGVTASGADCEKDCSSSVVVSGDVETGSTSDAVISGAVVSPSPAARASSCGSVLRGGASCCAVGAAPGVAALS